MLVCTWPIFFYFVKAQPWFFHLYLGREFASVLAGVALGARLQGKHIAVILRRRWGAVQGPPDLRRAEFCSVQNLGLV